MSELEGMTVNERLHELGLTKEFDEAVARQDAAAVASILRLAEVDEPSIRMNLEQKGLI